MTFEEQIDYLRDETRQINKLKDVIKKHDQTIIDIFTIYINFFMSNHRLLVKKRIKKRFWFLKNQRIWPGRGDFNDETGFRFMESYSEQTIYYKNKIVFDSSYSNLLKIEIKNTDWLVALKSLYETSRNKLEKSLEKEETLTKQILDQIQEVV